MRIDVYFLILPNMMMLDIIGPSETLQLARDCFKIHYISPKHSVSCSTGMMIGDLKSLPETLPKGSLLVLPGVINSQVDFGTEEALIALEWLKGWREKVSWQELSIVCICSGALLAARAGLLDGIQCTTHHDILDRLRTLAPAALVKENCIFIEDKGVCTCAGIMAGIDLALHLVHRFCSPQEAMKVAREMVVYFPRAGNHTQMSPWLIFRHHYHPVIHRAQDIIAISPEKNRSIEELAALIHVSSRHLSRLFRQHLGISVREFHEQMRLVIAQQYIKSGMGVEKAALVAGFSSSRQLRRAEVRAGTAGV